MAELKHILNSVETKATTTSSAFSSPNDNYKFLGADLDPSSDYVLIVQANIAGDNAGTTHIKARMHDGTSVLTGSDSTLNSETASDNYGCPYFWVGKITTPASSIPDYAFEMASNGTDSVAVLQFYGIAFKVSDMNASDYAYDEDTTLYNSLAQATDEWSAASVVVGDGSDDWAFFVCTKMLYNTTAGRNYCLLGTGGTPTRIDPASRYAANAADEEHTFGLSTYIAAPASTTYTAGMRSDNATRSESEYNAIFALNLNQFTDHFGVLTVADNTVSAVDTLYQQATASDTTDAGGPLNWLVIGNMYYNDGNDGSVSRPQSRLTYEIDAGGETQAAGYITDGRGYNYRGDNDWLAMFQAAELSAVGASVTLDLDLDFREDGASVPSPTASKGIAGSIIALTWDGPGFPGAGATINRVLTENTVVTDPVPGYQLTQERPSNSNVELLTDAAFLFYAFNRLAQENLSLTEQYIMEQNLRRDIAEVIGSYQQLTYPEDFSAWSGDALVTPNTDLDPNGVLSADTIADDNTGGRLMYRRSYPGNPLTDYQSGEDVSFSLHVKKDGIANVFRHATIRAYFNSGEYIHLHFDTSTGEMNLVNAGQAEVTAYGFEDGADYRRFYITGNDGGNGATQYWMDIYPAAGANLSGYNLNTIGSIVAWGAMINSGSLQPYTANVLGIQDAMNVIRSYFRDVSDFISLDDDLTKSITFGETGTTYTKIRRDTLRVSDSYEAAFTGIVQKQVVDSISLGEAEFLRRFKSRSLPEQIAIVADLMNVSRSKVYRDVIKASDSLAITRTRINNVTTLDTFLLSDFFERDLQYVKRKRLTDSFALSDDTWFEQGSTLQPSVQIEVGIEER